jgi:hypothetical protein
MSVPTLLIEVIVRILYFSKGMYEGKGFTESDNTITLSGKQALIERYTETFKKKMFADIKNRSIVGNKVIDWEIATNGLTGDRTSLMAIYEVENNLITKVWFIRE